MKTASGRRGGEEGRVLTMGTDCSGIDAPVEAMKRLGVRFRQKFATEVNEKARRWLLASGDAEEVGGDMRERDTDSVPEVDFYICGFPCQLFSNLNRNQKVTFEDERVKVLSKSMEYIDRRKPKLVLYENVPELMGKGKAVFDHVISFLQERYPFVKHTFLNACEYGCPQSRKRVFIVASHFDFEWPRPVRLKRGCMEGVEPDVVMNRLLTPSPYFSFLTESGVDQPGIVSASCLKFKHSRSAPYTIVPQDRVSPCLIRSSPSLYYTHLRRFLTGRECLWLQGFQSSPPLLETHRVISSLAGNSMCVDVLCHLFKCILPPLFHSEKERSDFLSSPVPELQPLRDIKRKEETWKETSTGEEGEEM